MLIRNIQPHALQLTKCQAAYASDAGILLQSADGVSVRHSLIIGLGTASASRGIVADADSDDNFFGRNSMRSNQTDVVDAGTSNCWRGNLNPIGIPLTGNASTAGCP